MGRRSLHQKRITSIVYATGDKKITIDLDENEKIKNKSVLNLLNDKPLQQDEKTKKPRKRTTKKGPAKEKTPKPLIEKETDNSNIEIPSIYHPFILESEIDNQYNFDSYFDDENETLFNFSTYEYLL